MALPRQGHLEQVLQIFGHLKSHKKLRIIFDPSYAQIKANRFKRYDWQDFYRDAKEDIPLDMPNPLGKPVVISVFVDSDHGGNKVNRKSRTGVLIFVNKAPVYWYSKQAPGVETSTFGAEFYALRTAVEMVKSLRYKLRMFGIPIDGPANVFCDNEAVYKNTSMPASVLNKKVHLIAYHMCHEAVVA